MTLLIVLKFITFVVTMQVSPFNVNLRKMTKTCKTDFCLISKLWATIYKHFYNVRSNFNEVCGPSIQLLKKVIWEK